MGICCQRTLSHLRQQLAKGEAIIKIGTHDQRIDEHAHYLFCFRALPVGNGRAYQNILLMAVAMQQQLKCGQQRHIQGSPGCLGDLLQGW